MNTVIDKELIRRDLYNGILEKVRKLLKDEKLRIIFIDQLITRYVLNKNITKTPEDDPIFITSESKLGKDQIVEDFRYNNIKLSPDVLIELLEEEFIRCSDIVRTTNIVKTKDRVIVRSGQLTYRGEKLRDISSLSRFDVVNAYALNLRYTYLQIKAHNLARTYKEYGYKSGDAAEGFASSFNHYFDEYCSAFPDLESAFGSRGSFFDVSEWHHDLVFVNPPFDVLLMTAAIYKVMSDSETMKNRFIFTLPNWTDMKAMQELKEFKYTTSFKVYKKGELPFVDYMVNEKKFIYPCDILEVYLQNTS